MSHQPVLVCRLLPWETWVVESSAEFRSAGYRQSGLQDCSSLRSLCARLAEMLLRISDSIIAVMHGTLSCARTSFSSCRPKTKKRNHQR